MRTATVRLLTRRRHVDFGRVQTTSCRPSA